MYEVQAPYQHGLWPRKRKPDKLLSFEYDVVSEGNSQDPAGADVGQKLPINPPGCSRLECSIVFLAVQLVCCAFPATSAAMPSILNNQYQMILARNRSYTVLISTLVAQGTTLLGIASYPLSSTPVNLTANSVLDFNFLTLPATSTISGHVTDSSGKGVAQVAVSAYSQSITGAVNLEFVAGATTDSNGDCTLTVLSGTNYTVVFYPPSPTP